LIPHTCNLERALKINGWRIYQQYQDWRNITVVTRLRLDAALSDPAPVRRPGTKGHPVKSESGGPPCGRYSRGKQRLLVPGWYGEGDRVIEVCSRTAVWDHTGSPAVPIRWVLIRDPEKRFDLQALLCTDLSQSPLTIVS
jgi:hypothetical protein